MRSIFSATAVLLLSFAFSSAPAFSQGGYPTQPYPTTSYPGAAPYGQQGYAQPQMGGYQQPQYGQMPQQDYSQMTSGYGQQMQMGGMQQAQMGQMPQQGSGAADAQQPDVLRSSSESGPGHGIKRSNADAISISRILSQLRQRHAIGSTTF
jgi:hypothetical protein